MEVLGDYMEDVEGGNISSGGATYHSLGRKPQEMLIDSITSPCGATEMAESTRRQLAVCSRPLFALLN